MGFIMRNGVVYTGSGDSGGDIPSGSSEIIQLTQAEYDALPEGKLTNDVLYLVDDGKEAGDGHPWIDINDAINGIVIWENPDRTVEFPNQIVTVEIPDGFEVGTVELIYYVNTTIDRIFTTGRIKPFQTQLRIPYETGTYARSASVDVTKKKMSIGRATLWPYSGESNSDDNTFIIPKMVIAYKKAEFQPLAGILPPANKVTYDDSMTELGATDVQGAIDSAVAQFAAYRNDVTVTSQVTVGPKFQGQVYVTTRPGICQVTFEGIAIEAIEHGDVVIAGLPKPKGILANAPIYMHIPTQNGFGYSAVLINPDGDTETRNLIIYYPEYTAISRIDLLFTYIL